MDSRSMQSTEPQAPVAQPRPWSETTGGGDRVVYGRPASLAASALAFAVHCHAGQLRESDGALFIEHPLEVGRLLRDEGACDEAIAAGLLHEVVVGEMCVSPAELEARFGATVANLVRTVSDTAYDGNYRQRMRVLREQVRSARGDAALLFAADSISNIRDLGNQVDRERRRLGDAERESRARTRLDRYHEMRMEHYHESLDMLERIATRHPLVEQLADELHESPVFL